MPEDSTSNLKIYGGDINVSLSRENVNDRWFNIWP